VDEQMGDQMGNQEKRSVLDEIVALTDMPKRPPDSITVKEYAEATGMSVPGARNRLETAVVSGVLVSEVVSHERRRTRVYMLVR